VDRDGRTDAGQTAGGRTLGWWMGDSYGKPVGRLLQKMREW